MKIFGKLLKAAAKLFSILPIESLHRMPEVIVQKEMPIIYRMRLRYGRNRWRER